jgi:predicted hydrolase (HD superfamily)
MKKKNHPGFKKVAERIEKKEGVSKEIADAILASAARKASPKAKKANSALKKVLMPK